MLVQALRFPTPRPAEPRREPHLDSRVAVLLNANARKVSERVVRALSHVVPDEDLFLSTDLQTCRRIAHTVIERGYKLVFTGGGDGTFVAFANEILRELEAQRGPFATPPRFGVLKLGTGNGLATMVNASSMRGDGILDDVLRARKGDVPGFRPLDLLVVDGKRTPFAGLGADGRLLNDYVWVKQNFGKGVLKGMLSGAGGYVASVAFRTAPHFLTPDAQVECEIRNGRQGAAYRLNPDGSVHAEIAPGGLLYRGRAVICAAATIPFYGFGLKMFPFAARRSGMMHLRVASNVTTPEVVANLPRIWSGRWFSDRMHEFHAREFTAQFAHPVPLQVGGDAEGYRTEVRMSVADEPIELVDYSGAVH